MRIDRNLDLRDPAAQHQARPVAGTKVSDSTKADGQGQHQGEDHGREHLALDALEGQAGQEDQEDDDLAVDGGPDHLLAGFDHGSSSRSSAVRRRP